MGSANRRRMPTRARPLAFCWRFKASSARTTERSGAASRSVTCGGKAFSALTANDFGRAGTTVVLNRAGSSTPRAERVAVKLASHPILEIQRFTKVFIVRPDRLKDSFPRGRRWPARWSMVPDRDGAQTKSRNFRQGQWLQLFPTEFTETRLQGHAGFAVRTGEPVDVDRPGWVFRC